MQGFGPAGQALPPLGDTPSSEDSNLLTVLSFPVVDYNLVDATKTRHLDPLVLEEPQTQGHL